MRALRRRWWLVLVFPLVLGGLVYAYDDAQPRRYDATVTLLAGQGKGIADLSAIVEVDQATQSLASMATDRIVVERAARDVGVHRPILKLLKDVDATVPPNTQNIEVTVTHTSPRVARDLANRIGSVFSKLVAERAAPGSTLSVSVWQPAVTPTKPSSPRTTRDLAVAILAGLLLGMGAALLREHLEGRWRSEEDVERYLGVPVLVTIPKFQGVTARMRRRERTR